MPLSASSVANMNPEKEYDAHGEKLAHDGQPPYTGPEGHEDLLVGKNALHRDLQGRHMQMIAM